MRKFIVKLLLYLAPVWIVLAIYAVKDPFKVLYHYNAYYKPVDSLYFELDDDYISTQTLIQNYSEYNYDSYIFGSSRSDNYRVSEWAKYINSGKCYHYNAAFESLYGMEKKMELLTKRKYPIRNALIILDTELLSDLHNDAGHIRLKHPLLSGQGEFAFQAEFLKDFFDKEFLRSYLDLLYSGHIKPYMAQIGVMNKDVFHYDVASNEFLQSAIEMEIQQDSDKYYADRTQLFFTRPDVERSSQRVIFGEGEHMLQQMKAMLDAQHTVYKVIVNPLYNQVKLNNDDLKILQRIFDKEKVFDFSGKNAITENKYNYYETSHYRERVSTAIMKYVYGQ